MTEEKSRLEKVKNSLGVTGSYQDGTINEYILEVEEFLMSSGVCPIIVKSTRANGIIARGVSDLWNYGSGNLSSYFMMRAVQLANTKPLPTEGETNV